MIYTNNNTDKTLNLLTENKNDDITIINNDYSEEFLNKDKITKLYHLREDFLQIIKKETFDYLILFDSDIFFNESIISKSLEIMKKNNFTTATTNTINNKPFYYDLFATIDGDGRKLGTDLKGTYPTIILYLKTLFWRNGIQNVKSAFGGFFIIKKDEITTKNLSYMTDIRKDKCEHLDFNKNFDIKFLNNITPIIRTDDIHDIENYYQKSLEIIKNNHYDNRYFLNFFAFYIFILLLICLSIKYYII